MPCNRLQPIATSIVVLWRLLLGNLLIPGYWCSYRTKKPRHTVVSCLLAATLEPKLLTGVMFLEGTLASNDICCRNFSLKNLHRWHKCVLYEISWCWKNWGCTVASLRHLCLCIYIYIFRCHWCKWRMLHHPHTQRRHGWAAALPFVSVKKPSGASGMRTSCRARPDLWILAPVFWIALEHSDGPKYPHSDAPIWLNIPKMT